MCVARTILLRFNGPIVSTIWRLEMVFTLVNMMIFVQICDIFSWNVIIILYCIKVMRYQFWIHFITGNVMCDLKSIKFRSLEIRIHRTNGSEILKRKQVAYDSIRVQFKCKIETNNLQTDARVFIIHKPEKIWKSWGKSIGSRREHRSRTGSEKSNGDSHVSGIFKRN